MFSLEQVMIVLEMIGVIAFSISGAMVAIKKRMDIFGVIFLGVMTALGGGITRDILLGSLPPAMFTNYRCIVASVVTSLIVFIVAYITREYYFKHADTIETINNVFDAIGLGVFSVMGIQIAQATGYGYNKFLLVCLGMITGVGGGLIRDVIVGRTPVIFAKHIYAVASIIGCIAYLVCMSMRLDEAWVVTVCIVVIFLIRMLSTHFKWNLPKIPIEKLKLDVKDK